MYLPRLSLLLSVLLKRYSKLTLLKKEKEMDKEVALEVTKPPAVPKDSLKEKRTSQSREMVLATFPIPAKDGSKGKGSASSVDALEKSAKAPSKDNPPSQSKYLGHIL